MDESTKLRAIMAYNIKKIREELNLTQQQLAEKSGITPLAICKIETEKVWPKDSSVEKIAAALGIEANDLFINKRLEDTIDSKLKLMQSTLSELQNVITSVPKKSSYTEQLKHFK